MTDPTPDPIRPLRWVTAAVVVVVAAALLAWLPTRAATDAPDTATASAPMLRVAPGGTIELADLPEDHQRVYRAAAADPEAFEAVTCYCGCEAFLDHRHLGDCFVRPDGGWERHATGCAICLAQARDVMAMRDDGVPVPELSRRIDAQYGAVTADPAA